MVFERDVLKKLRKDLNNKRISILIGARQVGKTTLMKMLYDEVNEGNNCLFLDLDVLSNYEKVSTFEGLLNVLRLNGYNDSQKSFFYLFLDEFQRYPDVVKIMKNVYDNLNNVKIFASVSSSLTIKNQIQESLAGRKIIYEIFPLSFEEFLFFKKEDKLIDNLKNLNKLRGDLKNVLNDYFVLFEEFLRYGGYPDVVLKNNLSEKRDVLESIFDLYVKKDLIEYLRVDKVLNVKRLIEYLAINNGQKIKYDEISRVCGLEFNEIKNYLEILSETYLIKIVRPFYSNKNKELVKIPKIYFLDNGVRNYFINNFNLLKIRNDNGFLFEGFILSELLKMGKKEINFWQDKNLNEVDFILNEVNEIIPIEIKFKETLNQSDFKNLNLFIEQYHLKKGYLVNLVNQEKKKNIFVCIPYVIKGVVK